jgi:spermidine synthase
MNVRDPSRTTLAALLMAWGAGATITQAILLRETVVLFFAGEVSWGIVLFSWLWGVGVGGWLGGYLVRRVARPHRWLALIVAIFAAAGPVSITVLRCARGWLDIGAGQYIPMGTMLWLSALVVSPFGLLIGGAFPTACKVARGDDDSARIGWVYWAESVGSLLGGVGFTFLLVGRVSATVIMAGCGLCLLALSCVWLRVAGWRRKADGPTLGDDGAPLPESGRALRTRSSPEDSTASQARSAARGGSDRPLRGLLRASCGLTPAVAVAVAVLWAARDLERWTLLRRWRSFAPGLTLRSSVDSRYQNLALGWREGQYELYSNGQPTAVFPEPTALRWPTQVALCESPNPRRILLLGGGAEGLLAEVLTHRCIQQVDYIELDPAALDMVRPCLSDSDRRALGDGRVHVIHQDVRFFVHQTVGPYDLIIGRFAPPASALTARVYTVDFYRRLAAIMSPDGVLVFETQTSPAELRPESAACTGSIYWTLKQVFPETIVGWGPAPLVLGCKAPGVLTTDYDRLAGRLSARGVRPEHFAPEDFRISDQLDPASVERRRRELEAIPRPAISTDLHPRIYLLWLQRWEQQMGERRSRHLERASASISADRASVFAELGRLNLPAAAMALLLPSALWLGWRRLRYGRRAGLATGAVLWSIATTGFVMMAVEIVLLFAYQALYGYVYERIGAIIGFFMLGLAAGSALMNRMLQGRQAARAWLVTADLVTAGLVAAMTAVLRAVAHTGSEPAGHIAVYGFIGAAGVLGGATFPLAAKLHGTVDRRTDRTAGAIEAADHLGACAGALLTGVALVPAIGILSTTAGLAGLKVLSAAIVMLTSQRAPKTFGARHA